MRWSGPRPFSRLRCCRAQAQSWGLIISFGVVAKCQYDLPGNGSTFEWCHLGPFRRLANGRWLQERITHSRKRRAIP
ncbi:hypothetical protein KCP74_12395 [Salmonella enterica subsp. enterica]|nr:hypothetical protein KCP74_12395 [Salmonella enterica subsp. enterica]